MAESQRQTTQEPTILKRPLKRNKHENKAFKNLHRRESQG